MERCLKEEERERRAPLALPARLQRAFGAAAYAHRALWRRRAAWLRALALMAYLS
jgi:hypothetical protein